MLVLSVLLLSFFLVFTYHPQSALQLEVKQVLDAGVGQFPFSSAANSHMQDVSMLLIVARVLCAFLICVLAFLLPSYTSTQFRVAGGVLITLPVLLAFVPWDVLFRFFHLLLFPQGNWLFPADSLIIQTYQPSFFIWYAIVWGVLCALFGILFLVFSSRISRFCSISDDD